jgi:hypothetical protein
MLKLRGYDGFQGRIQASSAGNNVGDNPRLEQRGGSMRTQSAGTENEHYYRDAASISSMATPVLERQLVTDETIAELQGLTSPEQHGLFETGDDVSIYYFVNSSSVGRGTVTIWHNKGVAALATGQVTLFGSWDEQAGILITNLKDESWTRAGEHLLGNLTFNLKGDKGIYSCGMYYRQG